MHAANPRRSMGKVPANGKVPTRVGGRPSQECTPGTASSVKKTGIPRFGASAIPKRSSSSNNYPRSSQGGAAVRSASKQQQQGGLLGSAHAPRSRSHSASRTPQRVLQPQSLNINPNRYSMTGGRGSFVGAKVVKDSRGLNDKAWQQKTVVEIIDFLDKNNYYKLLNPSDFPLNSTEFKAVFQFLLQFIIPGYEVPKTRIENELPALIKKIGYPFQVSKSCFQTLGTSHSWPIILGVLHYIVTCAVALCDYSQNITRTAFPSTDEDGFNTDAPSDELSIFRHLVSTYSAFNKGQDDFGAELKELEAELESNKGINIKSLKKQQREREECQKKLAELQHVPNRCEETVRRYQDTKKDLEAYERYAEDKKAYNRKKEKELEEVKQRLREMKEKKETLKDSVDNLKLQCAQKGICLDSLRVDHRTQALRQQIDMIREHIQEIDKRRWSKEVSLGKVLEALDNLVRKYNTDLISLELDEELESSLRMDISRAPQDLFRQLQSLTLQHREVERNLDQRLLQLGADVGKMYGMLKSKSKELENLEAENHSLVGEAAVIEADLEEKDVRITEEINQVKSQLMDAKQMSHADLDALKSEAEVLETEKEVKRRQIDEDFDKRERLQKESIEKGVEFLRTKAKERDELRQRYKDAVQAVVTESEKLTQEMTDLVRNLHEK